MSHGGMAELVISQMFALCSPCSISRPDIMLNTLYSV